MSATLERGGRAMAKKKGRPPKATGEGTPVRIDSDLVTKARLIASERGMNLAAYLSATLRPGVDRDFAKLVREVADEDSPG